MHVRDLLPWRELTIETSWSPDVAAAELADRIGKPRFFGGGDTLFVGDRLNEREFRFSRRISYRNSFLPVTRGEDSTLRVGLAVCCRGWGLLEQRQFRQGRSSEGVRRSRSAQALRIRDFLAFFCEQTSSRTPRVGRGGQPPRSFWLPRGQGPRTQVPRPGARGPWLRNVREASRDACRGAPRARTSR